MKIDASARNETLEDDSVWLAATDGSCAEMRNDLAMASSAENVLQCTTYLPKGTFTVSVHAGWIILSGEADWEYQRHAVVRAVCSLTGVTGVTDQVTIKNEVFLSAVKSEIEAVLKRRAAPERTLRRTA